MELSHLKQFQQLARTQNMQIASKILFLSQSALSKNLKTLEGELGAELFERRNHRIVLNQQGEIALAYINLIFEQYSKMLKSVQAINPDNILEICSTIYPVISYVLPRLCAEYPEKQISTRLNAYNIKAQLLDERYDILITPYMFEHPALTNVFLCNDWVSVSVPDCNPLSQKEFLTRDDLVNQEFAETKRGNPATVNYPNPIFAEKNNNRIIMQPNLEAVYTYAQNNACLFFTDNLTIRQQKGMHGRRNIPLMEEEFQYSYYAIYRSKDEDRVRFIVEWLKGYFSQESLN